MEKEEARRAWPRERASGNVLTDNDPENTQAKTSKQDRRHRPTLAEPHVVAQIAKNSRGESVRVTLLSFESVDCVDVGIFFTSADGSLQATKKGIALSIARLPELASAVAKAERRARELGLLDGPAP